MRLIAHRGLFEGPDAAKENHPDQIASALSRGYAAEVDVWWQAGWWLGHDEPTYRVDDAFLDNPSLWLHCKNMDALDKMTGKRRNYFWHQNDDYTLTSMGYVWTYPGKPLTNWSISVMPEWLDLDTTKNAPCFGICSDYIDEIKRLRA